MDTCVLVSLRTLGVAYLFRKIPSRNDQAIVMNIHAMKVSPSWKCNGKSTCFCVVVMSDSSLIFFQKIPKGLFSCFRHGSLG